MKSILSLCFALFLGTSLFAYTGNPADSKPFVVINPTDFDIPLSHIFFTDHDNDILFIDFQAINEQIVGINILRDEALMMEDDVTDVPHNTIYELNLEVIREGKYTVELVTRSGIVIHKNIWVE